MRTFLSCTHRCVALVAASAALSAAILPAAAHAGTYTVYSCKTPSGGTASGWEVTTVRPDIDQWKNGCPAQAFQVQMLAGKTHPASDSITATFAAPSGTEIRAYTLWRSAKLAPSYNYWQIESTNVGERVVEECRGSICPGLGTGTPLASANRRSASNLAGVRALKVRLTCALDDSSGGSCPGDAPAATAWLHRADVVLGDDSAPAIQGESGPLVESRGPLSGVQPVSITATDVGGGVYQLLFEVDGKIVSSAPIDANGGACVPPFTVPRPCLPSASATVGFDTASLADGPHQLRLLVTDATGTNTGTWGPITIVTANSVCNPQPLVKALNLRVGVRRGHGARVRLRATVTTAFEHRVRVSGRLLTPAGASVPGASVCVAERNDAVNAPLRYKTAFTTDANGRFSYVTDPGPSRRLYFVHRVPEGAVTASVLVRARAGLSISGNHRSLTTGESIRLRGRLRGRPIPAQGVLVEVQARRATGWQTFGTARTTRSGRFRFRYRFVRTRGVQHYALRARVPRQSAYPYATGASKVYRIRVIG